MEAAQAVIPERFGRYVLLDRIGEGGMAEVYRAIMPGAEGFRRTFVIKKILPKFNQSASFVDMFVKEARIVALLNHPSIVQVYDFGSVDGQYFLAMEYLRGHDVMAILRRVREMKRLFPIPVAVFVAHEVAGALAYAHTLAGADGEPLGIVHRDISPSNVMCLREGGVKLLDFGIASAASEVSTERTDPASFKGKLRYMAPERLRNEMFDARSDLYSLGVMFWELLTCRRLFRGASDKEILTNALDMPIPVPSALRPEVPASLDAIVMRMLERDPTKRYESGSQLADELEDVLHKTKFKSRHLPRLLVDLFGSGSHSSQLAMATVSPELLASIGDENSQVGSAKEISASVSVVVSGESRRGRKLLFAAAATVFLAAAALGLHLLLSDAPSARPAPIVVPPVASVPTPSPAVPTEVPAPPPVPPVPEAQPTAVTEVEAEASRRTNRRRIRRAAKSRVRAEDDAIARGRSIDPFAEAAQRGKR